MISIKLAKKLTKDHDLQACLIISVDKKGSVKVVTYGENEKKCKAIGEWAAGLWTYAISIVPFQTIFGWGNSGVPKKLDTEQLKIIQTKYPGMMEYTE